MREFLFRGKRVDNGEWVEGDKIIEPYGVVIQYYKNNQRTKATVIPETVGQYIDLTDKNGTKIFEGDIVDVDGKNGLVRYGDFIPKLYTQSVFRSSPIKGFYVETIDGEQLVIPSKVRTNVIGNIFDNPDLVSVNG